jgi:glycosyltransferase involved in cell wall biosynthesis
MPPLASSGAKLRILVVSNLFPPHVVGGAEVVAQRQAAQLRARGHAVSVFAGWVAPPDRAGWLDVEESDGIRIWRTPVVSFDADDNFYAPRVGDRFRAVLESECPDVVHFHNLVGLGHSLIPLAKRSGLPTVVTLHDHSGYCFRATALRPDGSRCDDSERCALTCLGAIRPRGVGLAIPMRLRRDYVAWALSHADLLISPSRALADSYLAAGVADAGRVQVISNGIDVAAFDAPARHPHRPGLRFICIAYLGEHKGVPELLAAAHRLAMQPDLDGRWTLSIVGDGHMRAEVERQTADMSLGGAVRYLGRLPREQVIAEITSSDVVVLASRWPENEPVVLLEAIAAGVAQLATNTGGMPDLVKDGVTGDLVPPGDAEALADAMAAYVRDPRRARRQGAANFARRSTFSEERSIDAIEAAYADATRISAEPRRARPLVLCAGDWPVAHVAEVCNHLYRLEEPCPGARLIWHGWADPIAWSEAALLWNWSAGASHDVIQRALHAGIPLLAPASCSPVCALEAGFGVALTYRTYLEAMVALARLPHDPAALRLLRRDCGEAARLLAASAPPERYRLGVAA